jgi:hypothetical protein
MEQAQEDIIKTIHSLQFAESSCAHFIGSPDAMDSRRARDIHSGIKQLLGHTNALLASYEGRIECK